jgi:hypothetical protein
MFIMLLTKKISFHPHFFFQLFIAFDQSFKIGLTKMASQRSANNMLKVEFNLRINLFLLVLILASLMDKKFWPNSAV